MAAGDGRRGDHGRPAGRPRPTRSTPRSSSGRPFVVDVKVNRDTAVPLIGTWQFPPIVQAEPTFGRRRWSPEPGSSSTSRSRRSSGRSASSRRSCSTPSTRRVGGVLIKGPSGTGKSTAVRGLAELLPEIDVVADCPFSCDPAAPCCGLQPARATELPVVRRRRRIVDLPLNATEDRVAGSVDVARALKRGRAGARAGPARGGEPRDPLRRRDQPPRRPPDGHPARRGGARRQRRRARGRLDLAPGAVPARRDDERGGGRAAAADRRPDRAARSRSRRSREPDARAEIMRRREAFTADPPRWLPRVGGRAGRAARAASPRRRSCSRRCACRTRSTRRSRGSSSAPASRATAPTSRSSSARRRSPRSTAATR